jgi:hypothetical protein
MWMVDQDRRDELVEILSDILRRLFVKRMGFVSAQLYESVDGGKVVLKVAMRTAKDHQQLTDSADVRRAYRAARRIATSRASSYRVVESFGDACGPEDLEER